MTKRSTESGETADSVTSCEQDESATEDSDTAEQDEEVEEDNEADSDTGDEGRAKGQEDGEVDSETEDKVRRAAEESRDPHPEPVLRTDCLYHVSCCVELLPEESVEVQEEKEVIAGEQGKFHKEATCLQTDTAC